MSTIQNATARMIAIVLAIVTATVSSTGLAATSGALLDLPLLFRPSLRPAPEGESSGVGPGAPDISEYGARWRRLSVELKADLETLESCRSRPQACSVAARRLLEIIDAAKDKRGRAQLAHVNRAVNLAVEYTSDFAQHGVADVWSSPLATFSSLKGDCEDYAVAKYAALLAAGVSAQDLRVMFVQQTRNGEGHAVLMARLDGHWLVLDNARMLLLDDRDVFLQYRPIVAFSTDAVPLMISDFYAGASPIFLLQLRGSLTAELLPPGN